jgi:hypothetical protein
MIVACITDLQWHVIVLHVMPVENLIFDKYCTDHVNHGVDLMGVRGRHFGGAFGRDAVAEVEYDCI